MMRIATLARALTLALACLAGQSVLAETVTVRSGEHAGFTRIVLAHGAPVDWRLSRAGQGYLFDPGRPGVTYDLASVWQLIPRDRLAGLTALPDGTVRLDVGCACHALPFELRPGVVVIDIRDGPPPAASVHERDAAGRLLPPLPAGAEQTADVRAGNDPANDSANDPAAARPDAGPAGGPGSPRYDWLDRAMATARLPGAVATTPPAPVTRAPPSPPPSLPPSPAPAPPDLQGMPDLERLRSLDATRQALLERLGDAMTRGVIEPALPATRSRMPEQVVVPQPRPEQLRVVLPDEPAEPGIDAEAGDRLPGRLTAQGAQCIPDPAVDLLSWGADQSPATALGGFAALLGEFDRPDPDAVGRAVRYHLHLGFGAEARALAAAFAPSHPDRRVWDGLAQILDGGLDQNGVFAGMEVCDTAAALWAVLGQATLPTTRGLAVPAILRTFSALPPHLRRHLGPALADRFLMADDMVTVQAIRDAILRAPGDPGPAVRVMAAGIDLQRDEPGAVAALGELASGPGPSGVRATVVLLREMAATGSAPPDTLLAQAEAMHREYQGAPEARDLADAIALGHASRDDFDTALDWAASAGPQSETAVWAMLAARGSDGQMLRHAVLGPGAAAPPLTPEADRNLARRLIDLGFPDAATIWLDPARRSGAPVAEDRLLGAEAALTAGDPNAALRELAGLPGESAQTLRDLARVALGEVADLTAAEPRLAAAIRARNWPVIARDGPEVWRNAAALDLPAETPAETPANPAAPPPGPLATARSALADSAAARATLRALLDAP